MGWLGRFWLVLALLLAGAGPANAKRVALVIGNDNYISVSKLQKAGNDASAMALELRAAGFEVLLQRDLNYRGMVKAVDTLINSITGGDEVVVFFAGHGVQIKSGSYLLPIDIEATSETEVEKTSYALNELMDQLGQAKAAFSLVMVDACRDNPLKSRGRNVGGTRGLNPPDPPKGQMVVYSASRGQQALDRLNDSDSNPNGVFTREFISRMRKPGMRVDELVRDVQDSVESLARSVSHEQRPALYNEARGNFYFFAPPVIATPAAASGAASAKNSQSEREDRFWDDAKLAGNKEGFQAYLDTYPQGYYANMARANISRLNSAASSTIPTVPAGPAKSASDAAAVVNKTAAAAEPPRQLAMAVPTPNAAGSNAGAVVATVKPGVLDRMSDILNPASTAPVAKPALPESLPAPTPPPSGGTPGLRSLSKITLPNGDRYEGEAVGVVRVGRGIYSFANGDRYEGMFSDNLFNGHGVLTQSNGDRYEGQFKNNLPDGKGLHRYASGDSYEGNFVAGVKQGQGIYRYGNGDRYEGPVIDNVFSGKGKLFFANGDRYEGEFRNNAKDGEGIHFFANGDRYQGEFRQGVQAGIGTHFYANGDRYVGAFAGGQRHGKGTYFFAGGQKQELEFMEGQDKTAASGGKPKG